MLARAHQQLIGERTRHMPRLRSALREFFPAALVAFGEDLAGADARELLAAGPDPVSAATLSSSRVSAALERARRPQIADKVRAVRAAPPTEQLGRPKQLTAAYAATVRAQTAVLTALQAQITTMQGQVEAHSGRHPDAEIRLSQPRPGRHSRRPGARRARRRPAPLPQCPRPQELRRHQPEHPRLRQEKDRARPARAQRPAPRHPRWPGLIGAECLIRCARLLRPATPSRPRPPSRPAPAGQPPRGHPARLPEDPHPLRRDHRLAHHQPRRSTSCDLTNKALGCLSAGSVAGRPEPALHHARHPQTAQLNCTDQNPRTFTQLRTVVARPAGPPTETAVDPVFALRLRRACTWHLSWLAAMYPALNLPITDMVWVGEGVPA